MNKKQAIEHNPDTGKLTNFHYGSEKDNRTAKRNQQGKK